MIRFVHTLAQRELLAAISYVYEVRGQQYVAEDQKVNLLRYTMPNGLIAEESVQYTKVQKECTSFFIRLSVYYNSELVAEFEHPPEV